MSRMSARSFLLVALIGVTLVLYGAVDAQDVTHDLEPIANEVDVDAFQPSTTLATTGEATATLQTTQLAAPEQFTDIMLEWQANEPNGSVLQLEIRVSLDGATWTNWAVVPADDIGTDGDAPTASATRWSNIYYVDLARYYQIRSTMIRPGTDGSQPILTSLKAHTLFVQDMPVNELPMTFADQIPGMTSSAVPMPAYVSRTAWGNPEGENAPSAPPKYRTATHLVVHHTADANTLSSREPNWASRVRAIWSYHAKTLGWGDIGYNWLIDPNGVIYAGRAGSTDPTRDAVGFHDTANHGSMGVSVIGTYMTVQPTAAAQNSLVNLLAWKAAQRNIDVLGKSAYYGCSLSRYCSPQNSGSIVPNLAGHRQVMPTACPGDAFFAILPQIRQRVVDRIKLPAPRTDNGDLTIDNRESTFTWAGELFEAACGFGSHANWSWASNDTDGVTNDVAAVWRPSVPKSGQYRVLAHIPTCSSITNLTTNARYEVVHGGGRSNVTINQHTQRGWVELGTFNFAAGTSGYVRLTDLTSEHFKDKRAIMFDAIQWIEVAPTPTPTATPKPTATPIPTPTPTPTPMPARLVSAIVRTPTVAVGDLLAVEFTIKNTGTQPIETQAPDAGVTTNPEPGWVYDEGECFAGGDGTPAYDRTTGRIRLALGIASGSTAPPSACPANHFGYPWRWGVNGTLKAGETRTLVGYVRFQTPGTYNLQANLLSESIGYYGTDGRGTAITSGTVRVVPENSAPVTVLFDQSLNPMAAVYNMKPTPTSLLGRTTTPISIIEAGYVGMFAWDGTDLDWGSGGPLGQSDHFIMRQTRAFYAPTSGTYRFRITTNDGGWLWINGNVVVRNPGLHGATSAEGSVYLSSGWHTLGFKMFEYNNTAYAGYSWQPPGAAHFSTIPPAASMMQVQSNGSMSRLVAIAADDMGGSGIKLLRYRVGTGAEQHSTTGVATITLGVGTHTINYQAEDKNGNVGSWKTTSVTVVNSLACKLTSTLRVNGSIDLSIACPDANAKQFEIQVRDTGNGQIRTLQSNQRQLTFFGQPGRRYELRLRASDGVSWGIFPTTAEATLSVPANASFTRILAPHIGR